MTKAEIEICLNCKRATCSGYCGWFRAGAGENRPSSARGRRYLYQGEMLMMSEIAARCGMDQQVLYNRLNHGWSLEQAVSAPVKRRPEPVVEVFGERHTLAAWATMRNLPLYVVKNRIKDGWSVEAALSEPVKKRVLLEVDGERITVAELARRLGVEYESVRWHIRQGRTAEWIIEHYGGAK